MWLSLILLPTKAENNGNKMSIYHDEIEIEDFEYDEDDEVYYYPCPCGDRFEITKVSFLSASIFARLNCPHLLDDDDD